MVLDIERFRGRIRPEVMQDLVDKVGKHCGRSVGRIVDRQLRWGQDSIATVEEESEHCAFNASLS